MIDRDNYDLEVTYWRFLMVASFIIGLGIGLWLGKGGWL